mgnify:CR=1 FL=1|tara:strand:+ start:4751 stop:5170 length:420 start_codon:yes stop_codon:yes gene_type:complete
MLPHKHPILFVENEYEIKGDTVVAWYTVPSNHPVFAGHFPGMPIWPGVHLIEGMNQTAGLHALAARPFVTDQLDTAQYVAMVTGVDNAKFRSPVFPNTRLTYTATFVKKKFNKVFYDCTVSVLSKTVANATICLTATPR